MKTNSINFIAVAVLAFSFNANARENIGTQGTSSNNNLYKSVMSGCVKATAQADLDINNLRAKILNGGDMWWDIFGTTNAAYQIPKLPSGQTGPSSQFASSLWIGGYDAGGQLKSAAQTYRQSGNDYWPGPLTSSATVDPATCVTWDKFFKINRVDVETYYNWYNLGQPGPNPVASTAMDVINSWPAYGPEGQPLAPYWDVNSDGVYDPASGDVPDFDVTNRGCAAQLYGDQCLFWVFNDKGNIHTETGGSGIGLEIQAQAFAFATNDEMNDASFYKYKVINKSSFRLDSTFFGVWDDADLGWYKDDYVGCDVTLGLGILYNATQIDGSGQLTAYGVNPPAIGIDFFEGPFADPDGLDNLAGSKPPSFLYYGDGIPDNERLGMGKFLYFNNNTNVINGNPTPGDDCYQYLTGTWRNGTSVTYGAAGTTGSIKCDYMFPGTSDQTNFYGTHGVAVPAWDELSSGNTPDDRRFLESAGPFKLQPGAVNTVTIGVPWARATSGGPLASVALLKGADAKAQLLFNNCFGTLNGPTAPNLSIQELDKELILSWSNPSTSNNVNESYSEDPDKGISVDSLYRFQGYQVYQLKDANVSSTELGNVDKARLILQCDKADGVKQIINYKKDPNLNGIVPQEMVNGANAGIVHSMSVKEDKFAIGDNHIVNNKVYYFAIIAYGYTPTPPGYNQLFIPARPDYNAAVDFLPYISGRFQADGAGVFEHHGVPHIPSSESGGTEQRSSYGIGPKLQRIEGRGNAGNVLDFTASTISEILNNGVSLNPVYENTAGPLNVKVTDPLNVPDGKFTFKMDILPSIRYYALSSNKVFQVGEVVIDSIAPNDKDTAIVIDNNGIIMHVKSIKLGLSNRPFTFKNTLRGKTSGAYATIALFSSGAMDNATWTLTNNSTSETVYSESTIKIPNEQIINGQEGSTPSSVIPKWGMSITTQFTSEPGTVSSVNNGFINATMTFADDNKRWLSGIKDQDGPSNFNWIRSGNSTTLATDPNHPFDDITGIDDIQAYEKVLGGTWAPYKLCATSPTTIPNPLVTIGGPAWGGATPGNLMKNLASIDVVITNDRSKWTRCPVLELQEEPQLSIGGAKKLDLRTSLSVDKQGLNSTQAGYNAAEGDLNGTTGMGWFPGYAINLETGERLNMAFGEDSWLATDHGNDMIWNPTSTRTSTNFDPIFGGKHYIYVFGHNDKAATDILPNGLKFIQRYDAGDAARKLLVNGANPAFTQGQRDSYKKAIYADAMWVNIPLLESGHTIGAYTSAAPFETDVTIKIRVSKPYAKFGTGAQNFAADSNLVVGQTYYVENGPIKHTGIANPISGTTFVALNKAWDSVATMGYPVVRATVNNAAPMYEFSTSDIATGKSDATAAEKALELISVVPNPYYAYSGYEKSSAQNIVKITNLPEHCNVTIYSLDGTLIRQFKRDETTTVENFSKHKSSSLDWDLKNQARIPIASGLYIIYIDAPGVGQKTLKWFGVMRPLDLESY